MQAVKEIIKEIKRNPEQDLQRLKMKIARKYRLSKIPSNSEILANAQEADIQILLPLLMRKPVRTISGIAVVAVMAKPYPCPGECIYCPRGENAPQSYTGEEPAALRAKMANYDPYKQVENRLRQLEQIGHSIDKVELIVMGGTFLAQPDAYQEWFLKRCLESMNDYKEKKNDRPQNWESVEEENERSRVRNVGITIETRPDFAKERHVDMMLNRGVTRVELGVQTIYDHVYDKVKRRHGVSDVIEATRIIRDSGLKVGYHMMPGLFSDFKTDLEMFRRIFSEDGFKPDFIKIYPTLVVKGTELYELWKRGEYTPYSDKDALPLICEIKKIMPRWVRTMRIQRDIPKYLIEAGVKKGDLGELVYRRLKEEGMKCRCIRCRDIGHLSYREGIEFSGDVKLEVETYSASQGIENFISIEDEENDALIAYLRLRFPSQKAHREEVRGASIVRELRVLGTSVPLGKRIEKASQHKGWGELLLKKAEEISKEKNFNKILITSAIGTREYYRRFGYKRVGPYMGKII